MSETYLYGILYIQCIQTGILFVMTVVLGFIAALKR